MAYLLVMGGLALSVLLTLGWGLVCVIRWLAGRLRGAGRRPSRRKTARPAPASRSRAHKAAPAKAAPAKASSSVASEPWRLTRWLARWRTPLPLGLLALLLYGGSRLAEHGMAFRPLTAPGEFHGLVSTLGWIATALLALACVNLLALWRCRR